MTTEPRLILSDHRPNEHTPYLCPARYPSETYSALTAGGERVELGVCPVCGHQAVPVETEVL